MEIVHSEFSKIIFDRIDELFANEIGPVAPILCEETIIEWVKEIKSSGQRVSLKTIPSYVEKLANQIDDPKNRQDFIDAVYEIEAIQFYKNSHT